jgi:photosystem II stability/assembly factor-like uncharacterized protein
MIRRSLLLVALLSAANLSALPWTTHGPSHGPINALASSASNPRLIYASDAAAVFRSDDNGDHWRVAGEFRDVNLIAVDPRTSDVAYIAVNGRVLKTVDGGTTWSALTALPLLRPRAIVIDPQSPETLYVGSTCAPMGFKTGSDLATEGVFKSTDGGNTWAAVAPKPSGGFYTCVEELALDPATPTHLFTTMSSFDRKQSASFDAALSWIAPATPVPSFDVLPDVRYQLKRFGVTLDGKFLVSEDAGFRWNVIEAAGLPNSVGTLFTALEADPATGRLFLATNLGLFRSGDGGLHWLPVAGVPPIQISSMVFNPVDDTISIGTIHGVMRIANPPAGPVTELDLGDVTTMAYLAGTDPKRPQFVYSQTNDYYYGAAQSRFFRSGDYGNSWQRFAPPAHDAALRAIGSEGDLYAVTSSGDHLYFQEFGGSDWFELYTPLDRIDNVVVDQKIGGRLYITGSRGPRVEAYRSVDNGNTWQDISTRNAVHIFAVDPSNGATVYATDDGYYSKSTDAGTTWRRLESERTTMFQLVVAPSDPAVLYRVVRLPDVTTYSLQRSGDAGESWTSVPFPIGPNARVAVHPTRPRTIFLSTESALWRSDDGGATFASISDGLPNPQVIAGPLIDRDGRVLHVSLRNAGVWELPLTAWSRLRTARH